VSLLRVYLDQNAWIRLSRQHYGRGDDDRVDGVLALVREASRTGRASFPLSGAHYVETYRRGDPASRQRLGAFMAEVSRFHTMTGAPSLLDQEVDESLRGLAGLPPGPGPTVFGRGVAHAFGRRDLPYFQDEEARRHAVAAVGAGKVFEYFETELLIGPPDRLPANGVARPTPEPGSTAPILDGP
jgi:hypothetical protein